MKRLAPGLYEASDRVTIERDDEGIWGPRHYWYVHAPCGLLGPYETLRDAREDVDDE